MGGRGAAGPRGGSVREGSSGWQKGWDKTARQRGGYEESHGRVFPTRTNMAGKVRTRGKSRGGRNKWEYPDKKTVRQEQGEWLRRRKAEGARRDVVEGQIRHAGRSPNHPPLKKALDSIFGQ